MTDRWSAGSKLPGRSGTSTCGGARWSLIQTRAVRLADLVTTTSKALREKYSLVGAEHIRLIENYLPPEFLRARRARHDGLVVGWTAAEEHRVDVSVLGVDSVLNRLLAEHPRVRVVTVGLKLSISHARYEHRSRVPFEELAQTICGFDIGLAPLADIPFNRARSTVKVKEYAAAGVPWLASPVGEYTALGRGAGGRLVRDDQWEEQLDRLIRSRRDRVLLGIRAKAWARRQTIYLNIRRWERAFEDAVSRAGVRRSP